MDFSDSTFKSNHGFNLWILFIVITSLFFIVFHGFGLYNHNQYMPLVYHELDSEYFANDWYAQNNEGFNVRYFYIMLIKYTDAIFHNVEVSCMVLTYLLYIGMSFSLYFLASYILKNNKMALLSVFVIAMSDTLLLGAGNILGGLKIYNNYLMPNMISWLFVIICWNFFLRKRYLLGFFILGFATLFQPIIALLSFVLFLSNIVLVDLFDLRLIKKKIVDCMKCVSFFLVSSFMLIPLYFLNKSTYHPDSALISYLIAIFRHPHHSMPSSWHPILYVIFFMSMAFFVYVFGKSNISKEIKKSIYSFVLVIFMFFIVGYVFVEIVPINVIAKAQVFRIGIILSILQFILFTENLYKRIVVSGQIYEKIFYILFPLSFLYKYLFIPFFCVWALVEILKEYCKFDVFKFFGKIPAFIVGLIVVILAFVGYFVLDNFLMDFFLSKLDLFIRMVFLSGMLYFLFAFFILVKSRKTRIFLLSLLLLVGVAYSIYDPLIGRFEYDEDMQNMCDFVNDNTLDSSVFLIPPSLQNFRLCANRSVVIDVKGVSFTDKGMVDWYERLLDVTDSASFNGPRDLDTMDDKYNSLSEEKVVQLVEKYGADYVLFETGKEFDSLINLYSSECYFIYGAKK